MPSHSVLRRWVGIPEDYPLGTYGIEIEAEYPAINSSMQAAMHVALHRSDPGGWAVTGDGSLRAGLEFISIPTQGRLLSDRLNKLYAVAGQEEYGWMSTVRCSTHIHASVLDLTPVQVSCILTAYSLVEPLLYAYCGEDREQGTYCQPWYNTRSSYSTIRFLVDNGWAEDYPPAACKYSGLNVIPMWRLGTLEFRQAPFWLDVSLLDMWWRMIDNLVCRTVDNWDEPGQVLDAYDSMGPLEFCKLVLGTEQVQLISTMLPVPLDVWLSGYDIDLSLRDELAPLLCTYKVTGVWDMPAPSDGEHNPINAFRTWSPYRRAGFDSLSSRIQSMLEDIYHEEDMEESLYEIDEIE